MRKMSMPLAAACLHEAGDDVVRIVGVAHRVGAAEQHLKTEVGHAGAELRAGGPTGPRGGNRMAVSKVAPPHISRE
jgi:hypothetical protein